MASSSSTRASSHRRTSRPIAPVGRFASRAPRSAALARNSSSSTSVSRTAPSSRPSHFSSSRSVASQSGSSSGRERPQIGAQATGGDAGLVDLLRIVAETHAGVVHEQPVDRRGDRGVHHVARAGVLADPGGRSDLGGREGPHAERADDLRGRVGRSRRPRPAAGRRSRSASSLGAPSASSTSSSRKRAVIRPPSRTDTSSSTTSATCLPSESLSSTRRRRVFRRATGCRVEVRTHARNRSTAPAGGLAPAATREVVLPAHRAAALRLVRAA